MTNEERRAYMKAYYARNRERMVRYQIEWRRKHPEQVNQWQRNYTRRKYDTNPEWVEKERLRGRQNYRKFKIRYFKYMEKINLSLHARARKKVHSAVRHGHLFRPDFCEMCDKVCKPHGHHYLGYNRPLSVIWLCSACHGLIHRKS